MTLGNRLRETRKAKGITQDGLAEIIGTSRGVVTNLEHNKIETPQPLILKAICNALEINQEWLVDGTGMQSNRESTKSARVLSDIYAVAKDLSEDEQLYILNLIKNYSEHINQKESP